MTTTPIVKQREALEMEMGFTTYLKMRVGIEFRTGTHRRSGPFEEANGFDELKLDEVGAEVIAIIIPRDGDGFGLGTVVEFERPLEQGEEMSPIMGPILEYAQGPWLLAAIPMLVHDFGGEPDDDGIKDDKWTSPTRRSRLFIQRQLDARGRSLRHRREDRRYGNSR